MIIKYHKICPWLFFSIYALFPFLGIWVCLCISAVGSGRVSLCLYVKKNWSNIAKPLDFPILYHAVAVIQTIFTSSQRWATLMPSSYPASICKLHIRWGNVSQSLWSSLFGGNKVRLSVDFFAKKKNIHCLSFIRTLVVASFPEQTFSQDLVAKWEEDTQKSRGWEVLGNGCPTEPMEIVLVSILSLKDCCKDWENFCLVLTRILMLSLQVYCSVSSVEMVAADMGEGRVSWCMQRSAEFFQQKLFA